MTDRQTFGIEDECFLINHGTRPGRGHVNARPSANAAGIDERQTVGRDRIEAERIATHRQCLIPLENRSTG